MKNTDANLEAIKEVKREILSSSGSIMVVRVELPKGYKGDVDQHPQEQLSYIERGQVEFEVDGYKAMLHKGAIQYIASNLIHRVEVVEDCVIIDVFTPIREDLL